MPCVAACSRLALVMVCLACGHENGPAARFCESCGACPPENNASNQPRAVHLRVTDRDATNRQASA